MNLFFLATGIACIIGMTFLFSLLGHKRPAILITTGLFLLVPTVFSIFGFLATGELSPQDALPWRIGYGSLFFCSLGSSIWLFRAARLAFHS